MTCYIQALRQRSPKKRRSGFVWGFCDVFAGRSYLSATFRREWHIFDKSTGGGGRLTEEQATTNAKTKYRGSSPFDLAQDQNDNFFYLDSIFEFTSRTLHRSWKKRLARRSGVSAFRAARAYRVHACARRCFRLRSLCASGEIRRRRCLRWDRPSGRQTWRLVARKDSTCRVWTLTPAW